MSTPDLFSQLDSKPKSRAKKPFWLWPLVGIAGGAFFMLLVYAVIMREDIQKTELEVPLVKAPESAVKTRPDAPGGMDVPNRDKLVFDLLVQEIRQPEQPEQTSSTQVTAANKPELAENPEKEVILATASATKPATQKAAQKEAVPPQPQDPLAAVIAEREAEAARMPEPSAPTEASNTVGDWGVQLASFVNEADATKALAGYREKFQSLLGGLTPRVQSVTLGQGKGKRYRAQFLGVRKNEAASLCQQLKQASQACLRVQR